MRSAASCAQPLQVRSGPRGARTVRGPPPEEMPEPIVRVLLKALAKSPDERYPKALAFAKALQEAAQEAETARDLPAATADLGQSRTMGGAPPTMAAASRGASSWRGVPLAVAGP